MRILITGGTGQAGRALAGALAAHDVRAPGHRELDVTDGASVAAAIEGWRPDAVVHCAALTDTARCEREPEAAYAVNEEGTAHVAKAAARAGAMLVAVSTNEVFDGSKGAPYVEEDAPHAINAYGASKAAGERRAMLIDADVRIVRTSWVYGDGSNFAGKVLAAAREGRALRFVTDEVAAPTSAADLAEAIARMIEADAAPGIYHLANEGEASRCAWAREIVRLAGIPGAEVSAITTVELRATGYEGPSKPPYSVLANTRARAMGIALRPWREALEAHFEGARVASDA